MTLCKNKCSLPDESILVYLQGIVHALSYLLTYLLHQQHAAHRRRGYLIFTEKTKWMRFLPPFITSIASGLLMIMLTLAHVSVNHFAALALLHHTYVVGGIILAQTVPCISTHLYYLCKIWLAWLRSLLFYF